MPIVLGWKDVLKQSQAVYEQFGESKWIPFAQRNAKISEIKFSEKIDEAYKLLRNKKTHNSKELHNSGIGKFLVLAAMGESLEKNIDLIKKYRDRFDLMTCDKGFPELLKQGITPDYVMICDCNVLYDRVKDYIKESKGVKLLATPYANPDWTFNWEGDIYFFINKDCIETEKKFFEIFGDDIRTIPAGSNVSNAMVVFSTGSDETQNINFLGYEKYFLLGYDYSWRPEGNYYAFLNPKPKRYYMNHNTLLDINGNMVFTSENLKFSAKWLYSYLTTFNLPVYNCSGRGLLDYNNFNFEIAMKKIRGDKKLIDKVINAFNGLKMSHDMHINNAKIYNELRGELLWQ